MKTRVLFTLLVALAVFGSIFGYKYVAVRQAMAAMKAAVRPPPTVSTTLAKEASWQSTLQAVGDLKSLAGITVRTESEGRVLNVAFQSGTKVAAGDLLIELDAAVETAQLRGLEASARLAELQLIRAHDLREARTNSPAELDIAQASFDQATAAVEQLRAMIVKKRVVAPFAGRAGITMVDPGQFLAKSDPIVQLEAIDPIHVDFGLPQQEIGRVAPGMAVRVTVDAFPGREFAGTIAAINPRVAETTRNVCLRAVLPNPDEILRPGMFARVTVDLPEKQCVIELPTAAIVYNPYGNAVYVVTEQAAPEGNLLIARQQFVELGATRGNLVAVTSGLRAGDQIVTSGQIKLRNGIPVQIDNTVVPSASPAPTPAEG